VDITELARRSSVLASTLRFYEKKGSITSIGRWAYAEYSIPAFWSGWRLSRWAAPPDSRLMKSQGCSRPRGGLISTDRCSWPRQRN
jgi:hypothetical protein